MKLTGNVADCGSMTKHGEVMMRSGARGNDGDIGWILPVTRIQEELGMQALYKADGSAVLIAPSGQELALRNIKDSITLIGIPLKKSAENSRRAISREGSV